MLRLWALGLLLLAAGAQGQTNVSHAAADPWAPLAPGSATVSTGSQLLAALQAGDGDIALSGNITLQPSDWQQYELPIVLDAPGETILIRSDTPGVVRQLNWGHALGLLNVTSGTTLALDYIASTAPGNRTQGVEQLPIEIKGSPLWPTVLGDNGHKAVVANGTMQLDIAKCNPSFVQVEAERIQQQIDQMSGVPGLGKQLVVYMGGVSIYYVNITFPASLFDVLTKQQIGRAMYSFINGTTSCYDSSYQPVEESGGGFPTWAIAVIASVVGCALLALLAVAFLWRRKRRLEAQLEAAKSGSLPDEENGGRMSKHGSGADLAFAGGGALGSYDHTMSSRNSGKLSGKPSGELASPMHSQWLRARFGPIEGLQLGELLGRGAFGKVYRGRWKGAIVAVKVIDHRVQPGKTYDLSREPLLSMSVSHPNVVITHKMCVVKVNPSLDSPLLDEDGKGDSGRSSSGGKQDSGRSGTGGGKLVPAIDGSGSMVEIVSPHDILQPGLYETWLVCEFCDRGSLADLVATGKLSPDPAQRDIVAVLCLLDIALGLEYLHSNSLIHGDLKPANVMLKAARNDRRGFICKLGDFGLSRMLGAEESHVDTQSYGTASYAAPELLTQGKLTKAADVFSLGIIMWEVVSGGQELYPGLTAMQVILQVSQHGQRPEPPADCPPALQDLMQRCWSQDATHRPTAEQVVEDLRQQLMAMRPAPHAAPPRPPLPPQTAAAPAPQPPAEAA
ncbi:kinase [Chlorella sorokiniana]|uniref:Kinase n=1 Tax=Chlorella sorokiniana TaxID=3076 RepID=A0A2P6TPG3_CHLSO|nr:kinase [Chlorella sorokiniana]|eukprot:PRW55899.1 kinase [Chlorella sorokiniana]